MKILCFFRYSPPSESKLFYAGGTRQFIEITKVWARLGNEIHVIGSKDAYRLCQEFGLNAITHRYKPVPFKRMGFDSFVDIKKMLRIVPKEKFDFIYGPSESFPVVVASTCAKRKLRAPLVVSVNLFNLEETEVFRPFVEALHSVVQGSVERVVYPKSFPRRTLDVPKRFLRNLFLRKADLIFSVGFYIKNLLKKVGVEDERIFVVGSGINYDSIQAVKSKGKSYDACFLGSIIPRKGVIDLVEVWREVARSKPDAKLVIIGSGWGRPYENRVRELIGKYGLQDNINMTGFVGEMEKYWLMKQSRIFVFPSHLEGVPLAICEAMACGLPVVAYKLPGYTGWYGNNLVYVKKGDVEGLTSAVMSFLEDDFLRRKMGKKAMKRAKQYTWDSIAKHELETVTEKLLA